MKVKILFMGSCFYDSEINNVVIITDANVLVISPDLPQVGDKLSLCSAACSNQFVNSLDDQQTGVVTHCRMHALRGGSDLNDEIEIAHQKLHNFINDQVKEAARRLGLQTDRLIYRSAPQGVMVRLQ